MIILIGIALLLSNNVHELRAFREMMSGRFLEFIQYYRSVGIKTDARANYGIFIDTSSLKSFIQTFIQVYLYYLLAPLPWKISNLLDIYAAFESLWRLSLIVLAFIVWYRSSGSQRKIISFLILIYFSMSALWSLGTVNYGTSIRHHLVNYWILILLLGIYLHRIRDYQKVVIPRGVRPNY